MENNPTQIAARVRELREILEISVEDIAKSLGITPAQYLQYETDKVSMPISTLYKVADIFNVDFTVLLTGESPRMAGYTLVRAGHGVDVDRYPGYKFQSLAFNFIKRSMEPMIVQLEDDGKEAALVTHSGQEFNLVMKGNVKVVVGKHEFILHEGDSFYFDPTVPHGQRAVGGPATFLTVIQK